MSVELSSRRRMRGRMLFIPLAPPGMPEDCMDPSKMRGRSLLNDELLLSSNKRRRRRGLLIMSGCPKAPACLAVPTAPPPRPPERRRMGRSFDMELEESSFNRVIKRRGDPKRSVEPPNPPPFMRVMMSRRSLDLLLSSSSRSEIKRSGLERRSPPIPVPPCDMRRMGRSLEREEEEESSSRREINRKVFMSRPGAAATWAVLTPGTVSQKVLNLTADFMVSSSMMSMLGGRGIFNPLLFSFT